MSNTIITVEQLARDASLLSSDRLGVAEACSRSTEAKFAPGKGSTVKVQVPAIFVAEEFSGTTTVQDIKQTCEDVVIEKHFDVTVNLTTAQKSLQLDDFNAQITVPAVNALMTKVAAYITKKMHGFQMWSGTGGTSPSTMAHIAAADKVLNDALLSGERYGIVDTTAKSSLIQLAQFQSRDYGDGAATDLMNGNLGKKLGINWKTNAIPSVFSRGDVAGTVLLKGAKTAGATSLTMDAFTNATGTIYEGVHFTISGDTTVYVVTADATKAGSEATLSIYPALQADAADNAPITFKAAATDNFVLIKGAIAAAILPPAPLAVGSAIYNANGVGIRVTSGTSTSTLSDTIVLDVLVGAKAVHRYAGAVWQA